MAEKNIVITSIVGAGLNSTYDFPIILNGVVWMVTHFGAADMNLGDNKSSVYVLKWGSDIERIISLTGNTSEIALNKEFTGDGVKKLSILRMNKSGFDKQLPCWIRAYQRG